MSTPPRPPQHELPPPWYTTPIAIAIIGIILSLVGGAVAGRISADQHTPTRTTTVQQLDPESLTAEQRNALRGPAGGQGERGPTGARGERGPTGPAAVPTDDSPGATYRQTGDATTLIDDNATPVVQMSQVPDGPYLVLFSVQVAGSAQNGYAASCTVRERAGGRSRVVAALDSAGTGTVDSVHAVEVIGDRGTVTVSCVRRSTDPVQITNARLTLVRVNTQAIGD